MGSWGSRDSKIIIVGLDNSGKTTLINCLKAKKTLDIVPTPGFGVEKFKKNKINFTVFDMSGQSKYRTLWEQYYEEAEAVIFLVDSSDKFRVPIARNELDLLLSHKAIATRTVPILFYANKMDVPGSLTESEVSKEMSLELIKDRSWNIFASNALTGEGVQEGISWLSDRIKGKK
eukprot:TRINITY_DN2241_c0_g1_i4.p8 TRINITY_DN2241_c0_g1~~TRINITY_DN2241_c0_g1_i4.p8  ORF type:complete len:175 (+),score=56.46 TRINITY_DN2241_c0_g1_i4:3420-3944(+)